MERDKASSQRSYDETPAWVGYGQDQAAVEVWVRTRHGDKVFEDLGERTARVLEEAVELFDSEHKDRDAARAAAHRMVDMVFDKPRGEQNQEASGVVTTFLAYCAAKGLRMDKLADEELKRIQKLSVAHFRARQNAKAELGAAVRPG